MKKVTLFFTFLVISSFGFAQKHVNIPGTKVSMVLPKEGSFSKKFPGIRFNENAYIRVVDGVKADFYSSTRNLNKEFFESSGLKFLELKEFKLDGYSAKLVWLQPMPKRKVFQLVFGDDTFSTMIMGMYAAEDKKMGKLIRETMLTATYDKKH